MEIHRRDSYEARTEQRVAMCGSAYPYAFSDLRCQTYTRTGVGSQIYQWQLLRQRILCDGQEASVLIWAKCARAMSDVIGNSHNLHDMSLV